MISSLKKKNSRISYENPSTRRKAHQNQNDAKNILKFGRKIRKKIKQP